jgi:hypothetical protein
LIDEWYWWPNADGGYKKDCATRGIATTTKMNRRAEKQLAHAQEIERHAKSGKRRRTLPDLQNGCGRNHKERRVDGRGEQPLAGGRELERDDRARRVAPPRHDANVRGNGLVYVKDIAMASKDSEMAIRNGGP